MRDYEVGFVDGEVIVEEDIQVDISLAPVTGADAAHLVLDGLEGGQKLPRGEVGPDTAAAVQEVRLVGDAVGLRLDEGGELFQNDVRLTDKIEQSGGKILVPIAEI